MTAKRTQAEKELDARRNAAARRETVERGRARSATDNLEQGLSLQEQAVAFAGAFAEVRKKRDA